MAPMSGSGCSHLAPRTPQTQEAALRRHNLWRHRRHRRHRQRRRQCRACRQSWRPQLQRPWLLCRQSCRPSSPCRRPLPWTLVAQERWIRRKRRMPRRRRRRKRPRARTKMRKKRRRRMRRRAKIKRRRKKGKSTRRRQTAPAAGRRKLPLPPRAAAPRAPHAAMPSGRRAAAARRAAAGTAAGRRAARAARAARVAVAAPAKKNPRTKREARRSDALRGIICGAEWPWGSGLAQRYSAMGARMLSGGFHWDRLQRLVGLPEYANASGADASGELRRHPLQHRWVSRPALRRPPVCGACRR
mmetsp:Transcript_90194/g.250611  ORF Transcript_90194/g.250611 Transcript_90194/m.250611 type:complete len:301 (-) Transcript_90194:51-953(-)